MEPNTNVEHATARAPVAPIWRRLAKTPITRLAGITILIFLGMSLLSPERFLSGANLTSMAFQFPEYAILSLAMMMVMLTGGIDLSIVGAANLSAIVAALILSSLGGAAVTGLPALGLIALACGVSVAVGLCAGLVNGVTIAVFGLPPILATLGSGLVYTGLGVALTGGSAVLGFPEAFAVIGNGSVLGVPVPLAIFAGLAALLGVILTRAAFGTRVILLGANPLASRFAGVNDLAVTLRVYAISGMFSACAGLIIMSRANSAKADYGTSYLLLSILVCVLGGINPYGGFGRVSGLVLAVLSMQFLSSGLNLLGISNFAKELMWGALLLVVMVANSQSLFGRRR